MKLTFCTYDWHNFFSGPNTWLRRLLPELRKRDIECEVLFINLSPPQECTLFPFLQSLGFVCKSIPEPHYTEQRVQWILTELAKNPPDVFVPDYVIPAFYAGKWIKEAGIPTVGVLRSDDDYYRGIAAEFVLGLPDYQLSSIVCVSRMLEKSIVQYNIPKILVERIPSGVPLPASVTSYPQTKLKIAYLGRLVEVQKQISQVTHALCRAVKEIPNTEAVMYGDGADRPAVEQILQSEGAGLPIELVGAIANEQVQSHLLTCHVLVLLSDFEGLPVAVMEAMACGVVPICLQIDSGIPELIEHEVTGLIVSDRGDDFVAAVRRLREEPELWQRLSQAARAKIEAEYSFKICVDRYIKLFHKLQPNMGVARQINVPKQVKLPPVAPIFAGHDCREPSIYQKTYQKSRILAGRLKNHLLPI
ncbi:MAG: glycosyltransferase family 4 protein [Xenococcaceae cyanobacterium MO_207.B15]|nr:glycosyltransferase family 4 protein [Xenococcaceae cyanobacterium MO_207.B15]